MRARLIAALLAACCLPALAQTVPTFYPGSAPPLATWNAYFAGKQDLLTGVWPNAHMGFSGSAPAVSACGTGTPSIDAHATDNSGTVTAGTVATTCTITFHNAYATYDHCSVTPEATYAAFAYSYTLSAITVTGTAIGGALLDYRCDGA